MNTPIHDFLVKYSESGTIRAHMPGGKGLAYPLDITEINGADELYESCGIIRESERNTAGLFGAAETCYSCGGATLAIQAMLAAVCAVSGKRTVAAGRYSHKSLINSAVLLGLNVKWIYPRSFLGADITPEAVGKAIDSDTAAVFVNSVDYLGGECDIRAVSAVCRKRGVLLLVDNAHGAYKVFTDDHPLMLGADMTADSAHKTLPAITGTAYLHLADRRFYTEAKAAMSLFGSSSPSYLMLDSLDLCARYIAEKRNGALETISRVRALKKELSDAGVPLLQSDAMRITVDAAEMGYTGEELGGLIRERGAECEMCAGRYCVMLFSAVQPENDFPALSRIMREIPRRERLVVPEIPVIVPEKALPPREAFFSRKKRVPVKEAAGRICAGISSPCPPCVPVVMPGEVISGQAAETMLHYGVAEISVTV